MQRSRAVFITGIIYALIGLVLAGGGIWLAALGGSIFYIILGVGILATAALLAGSAARAMVACDRAGRHAGMGRLRGAFDWRRSGARRYHLPDGACCLPARARLAKRAGVYVARRCCWVGVAVVSVVLVVGLLSGYHDINGTIVESGSAVQQSEADPQPDGDWRAYGRTQFGQRYSPLKQITPDNVGNLRVAWTFRTGDVSTPNDSGETTFEVTPIKARDTLYLLSTRSCLRRQDRRGALAVRSQADVQQHVPAHDLPRGLLPRNRGGRGRQQRQSGACRMPAADLPAGQ